MARRRRTEADEFRYGSRVITTELPDDYTPPSASMNPDASIAPADGQAARE